jgi:hypothetical protein
VKSKTKQGIKVSKIKSKSERAIVVTTEHRGVFFGYAAETDGESIKLRASRLCVYWSAAMGGFMGLAEKGPDRDCKIGPRADITLRKITSVIEVTPAAVERWEAALWKS